jgi:hypothetical protein
MVVSTQSSFFDSIYAKISFGAILAFIGVVGGIYVGNYLTGRTTNSGLAAPIGDADAMLDEKYVSFAAGDAFPLEPITYTDGSEGQFETLLRDRKSLLLFVSRDCEPCIDMLDFWKTNIIARLRPEVQVVACLADDQSTLPPEYVGLVEDMTVVYYDGPRWRDVYELKFNPLIVGVDESGIVKHIQFGFNRYVDFTLTEYFFLPD